MNKNNTKQKLIEAMYELIAKEGYEKASINKVCTLAGVKKPTFYHYFNSKEEIFINIIKETYPSDFDDILKQYNLKISKVICGDSPIIIFRRTDLTDLGKRNYDRELGLSVLVRIRLDKLSLP